MSARRANRAALGVGLLALSLHLALGVVSFWPTIRSGEVPRFGDHWIHAYRVVVSTAALEHTGSPRGYDPEIVAGAVQGTLSTNTPLGQVLTSWLSRALGPSLTPVSFRAPSQPNLTTGWDPLLGTFLGETGGRSLQHPALRERFDRYAITWIVTRSKAGIGLLRSFPPALFSERHEVAGYLVFRLAEPGPLVVGGPGSLRSLPGGRLELSGLRGAVTLRLHWAEGLTALEPGARVEQAPDPLDPAGWIHVLPGQNEQVTVELR